MTLPYSHVKICGLCHFVRVPFAKAIRGICYQIGADGRRSQIFLAMSTAAEFRDHLSAFSDFYSSLGPPNPDNVPDDGKLKSEMMLKVHTSSQIARPREVCHTFTNQASRVPPVHALEDIVIVV